MEIDFTPDILVVDDRRENLDLLKALLGKLDVNLELFQSSNEALAKALKKEYALILLDIQMPELDGFSFAEKVRETNRNSNTPIIFLTAFYLDKESEQKGYDYGCADFIIKPFNAKILKNKVNVFLDLYRNKKEKELHNQKLNDALKEKELFESRLRNLATNYRTILEGQHELILKVDSSLRIEFANKAFTDFFDYSLDGISANTVAEINEELSLQFTDAIKKMNGKRESYILEQRVTNYRSEPKWIEWSIYKQIALDDIHYQIIGRDVSDRKFLKDSLVKKELLIRKVQKMAGLGTFEWDSYTNILRGSQEFYKLYDVSESEVEKLLDAIRGKVHPDDLHSIERLLMHLSKKNQKLEFEHRLMVNKGNVKNLKVELYVNYDPNTDVISVNGLSRDITESTSIGNVFKHSLGFDKTLYKDKAFFELNERGEICFVNEFAKDFLDCEGENCLGKSLIDFILEEERDRFIECLDFKTNKKGFVLEIFSLRTCSSQLKKIILAAHLLPVNDRMVVKGIMSDLPMISDSENLSCKSQNVINGLKRREKETEKQNKKLKNKIDKEVKVNEYQQQLLVKKSELESLGKIARSVVHEINQPLTGISMVMDNILLRLSMDKIDEEYIREKCTQVFSDIDRIKSYVSQIGIFNSAQKESEIKLVDVNKVVDDSVKLVQKHYRNTKVNLKVKKKQDELLIAGNKYKLQKVIVDILNNSYDSLNDKSAEAKKLEKEIEILTKLEQHKVVVSIKDNGLGIDPDNLNFIFEPFFSTKKNGEGSGLGLYVSRDVVQKMNGKIDVSSKKGEYTEMKLIFPNQNEVEKKEVYFKET